MSNCLEIDYSKYNIFLWSVLIKGEQYNVNYHNDFHFLCDIGILEAANKLPQTTEFSRIALFPVDLACVPPFITNTMQLKAISLQCYCEGRDLVTRNRPQ